MTNEAPVEHRLLSENDAIVARRSVAAYRPALVLELGKVRHNVPIDFREWPVRPEHDSVIDHHA